MRLLWALLVAGWSLSCLGQLELAATLGDGMVVQRGKPIVVWGTAPAAAKVVATMGEATATGLADAAGNWRVALPAREATTEPVALVLSCDGAEKRLRVWVGDVWYCAGQSNMAMTLAGAGLAAAAKEYDDNAQIRHLRLQKSPYTGPLNSKAMARLAPTPENKARFYKILPWQGCDGGSLPSLSAVAYWFARKVQQETGVPIGLIVPPLGGSAVQAWVPRAAFENDPDLRPMLDRWIGDEPPRLQQQLGPWVAANPGAGFDQTPLHRHRPTTLFEAAVAPLAEHAIRGVIWYQGEQNAQNAVQQRWHELTFPHLIAGFRENWRDAELPVYVVQLPGYGNDNWPAFREQQRQFARLPRTAMAVAIDLGNRKNIHPKDKRPVGERLALLALRGTYGRDMVASGPEPEEIAQAGKALRIRFGGIGEGLRCPEDQVPGFELAGADGVWHPATAKRVGKDALLVASDVVAEPQRVRYAWAGFPRPLALANSAGLPAGPFVESVR